MACLDLIERVCNEIGRGHIAEHRAEFREGIVEKAHVVPEGVVGIETDQIEGHCSSITPALSCADATQDPPSAWWLLSSLRQFLKTWMLLTVLEIFHTPELLP
jgi:hypothetical protein